VLLWRYVAEMDLAFNLLHWLGGPLLHVLLLSISL